MIIETGRHPLAYPAYPAEVVRASEEARQAMRWPLAAAALLVLLVLTATLAILVLARPIAGAAALTIASLLLLLRSWRPGRSYDWSIGWVYRIAIVAGVAGELASRTLMAGANPVPSWQWIAADALGVGGAIGLGVALASCAAAVVLAFIYSTATFRSSPAKALNSAVAEVS